MRGLAGLRERAALFCIDMPLKWVRKHLLKTHRPAGLDLTPTQRTGASPWPDTDVMHDTLDRQRAS